MNTLLKQNLPQVRDLMRLYGVRRAFAFGSAVSAAQKVYSEATSKVSVGAR